MQPEIYLEMAKLQDRHWWFVARRMILDRVISELRLPANALVLEIGCGPGGNLSMLKGHGQLHALETDPLARQLASVLSICPVLPGALPAPLPFPPASFDLVCLFDVLEHIEDDQAALQSAATLLRPGGRILITVPAYPWLWSAHDEAHHHKRRYTASTLNHVAKAATLAPLRLGYFNTLLFPMIALLRGVRGSLSKESSSDCTLPSPWINQLLTRIFAAERWILSRATFPFGTSLLAVLEAPSRGARK